MNDKLPDQRIRGAILREEEYGTVYELYWMEANSSERLPSESWEDFARRSCVEVLAEFTKLIDVVVFERPS
jgi:hypothetical protein